MPEMKKRPGQGAPSASTTATQASTEDHSCGIAGRLRGVKFKFTARVCKCGADVCIVGTELAVSCSDCGVRRGHLSDRTAQYLEQVCAQFGPPINPVILRREAAR
jgi:hypothetical protein